MASKSIWEELDQMHTQFILNAALQQQKNVAAEERLQQELTITQLEKEADRAHEKEIRELDSLRKLYDNKVLEKQRTNIRLQDLRTSTEDARFAFSTLPEKEVSEEGTPFNIVAAFNSSAADEIQAELQNLNQDIVGMEKDMIDLNKQMQFINTAEDVLTSLAVIKGPQESIFGPSDVMDLDLTVPEGVSSSKLLQLSADMKAGRRIDADQLNIYDLTRDAKIDEADLAYLNTLAGIDKSKLGTYEKVKAKMTGLDELEDLNKQLLYEAKIGTSEHADSYKILYAESKGKVADKLKAIKNNISVIEGEGNQTRVVLNPAFENKFRLYMNKNYPNLSEEKKSENINALHEVISYVSGTGVISGSEFLQRLEYAEQHNKEIVSLLKEGFPTLFSQDIQDLRKYVTDESYWNTMWRDAIGIGSGNFPSIKEEVEEGSWEAEIDEVFD